MRSAVKIRIVNKKIPKIYLAICSRRIRPQKKKKDDNKRISSHYLTKKLYKASLKRLINPNSANRDILDIKKTIRSSLTQKLQKALISGWVVSMKSVSQQPSAIFFKINSRTKKQDLFVVIRFLLISSLRFINFKE